MVLPILRAVCGCAIVSGHQILQRGGSGGELGTLEPWQDDHEAQELEEVEIVTNKIVENNAKDKVPSEIGSAKGADELIQALVGPMKDEDRATRAGVAMALAAIGNETATEALIWALVGGEEDAWVRVGVASALGVIGGETATEALSQALVGQHRDESLQVRVGVANALGVIGGETATEALSQALVGQHKDASVQVRVAIARHLGAIGDEAATEALGQALVGQHRDASVQVRAAVAGQLGAIGTREASVLCEEAVANATCTLRRDAIRGTCKLAIAALKTALGEEDQAQRDEEQDVRKVIYQALFSISNTLAADAYGKVLGQDVRAESLKALEVITAAASAIRDRLLLTFSGHVQWRKETEDVQTRKYAGWIYSNLKKLWEALREKEAEMPDRWRNSPKQRKPAPGPEVQESRQQEELALRREIDKASQREEVQRRVARIRQRVEESRRHEEVPSDDQRELAALRSEVEGLRRGSGGVPSLLVYAPLLVLAVLAVAALCCCVGRFIVRRRLQDAKEVRKIREALEIRDTVRFPLVVMPGDIFLSLQELVSHEEARASDRVIFLDNFQIAVDFFIVTSPMTFGVFFSHQWTSFTAPDPSGEQLAAMKGALDALTQTHQCSAERMYVWVDYFSIPQVNAVNKSNAIQSLPVYVSLLSIFVIVALDVVHADTRELCNMKTYMKRGWCRAEQLSYKFGHGGFDMYWTDGSDMRPFTEEGLRQHYGQPCSSTYSQDDDWEAMPFDVFRPTSEFTCCSRKHKSDRHDDPVLCDRHALMLPMLGLYAKMLDRRNEPRFADLLPRVEERAADILPRTINVSMETGDVTQELFGNLVPRIRRMALQGRHI